ncbi:hypothetical protein SHL15_9109 [Streptomyces hygroscopicus subsp. limoneus]|nr:hypothetical protein SHL15_9109 [Streptomyces hygroscopicus subsp. limoneus]
MTPFHHQTSRLAELLSEDEYAQLQPLQRESHDEERLDHHARLRVVATCTDRHTVTCGRRLVLLNTHASALGGV